MIVNYLRKKARLLWRRRRLSTVTLCAAILLAGGLIGYAMYMPQRHVVDPASYQPLLHLIAKAESSGNYNAYYGNAANDDIKFTHMTIAEVMDWQAHFVAQGNPSSAVGRYQIIGTTLAGLVRQLGVDTSHKFDKVTQDRLAIALLERRGAVHYVNQELSPQEFAANLAKEWAGLPRVLGNNPEASYYAGDGLNQSRTSTSEVMQAVAFLRAR